MTPTRYQIPANEHEFEQDIKHSRFIATVVHAPTLVDAKQAIATIAARYPDANHNCWAFQIGLGPHAEIGSSDDGEPAGTAGRPMLQVLQGSGIGDIAAVVTRYFGGIKLGTGGLVRAYSGTLQKALNDLPTKEQVIRRTGMVTINYNQYELLRRLLTSFDPLIESEDFASDITLMLALPQDRWQECADAIRELTYAESELIALDD
ncbi:YigZ family protein [Herpetosiphon llansteffanensis]|uniref:YigZ family protein n=1 Tax=Herpetosiphon llansteffanensis TaxID=2094568 RepID=UPI000D7CE5B1|nr:YigZ family protein [Herpetosiphon llansteffanensis]